MQLSRNVVSPFSNSVFLEVKLHLFQNGHSFLFPMPFASPSLRLGQKRTRSLSPPCSSKGLRSGICNWDHTQSHSRFTRATATLFMSLLYHVPTPENMGLVPPLAWQKVGLPAKEGHFPHSNGKKQTKMISCFINSFPAANFPSSNFTSMGMRRLFPHLLNTTQEELS